MKSATWKEAIIVNSALAGLLVAIIIVWMVVQVVLIYRRIRCVVQEVWKRV